MTRGTVVATTFLALLSLPFCTFPCGDAETEIADAATAKRARIGNGIRLVGASGARGRLEVSSTSGWMLAEGEVVSWRPVCAAGGLVDNTMAQVMCKLLGYKYGRRYFSLEVEYRPPNASLAARPDLYDPVGYVYCNAKTRQRRLDGGDSLHGIDVERSDDASDGDADASEASSLPGGGAAEGSAEGDALDGGSGGGGGGSSSSGETGGAVGISMARRRRHARSLLAPLYGTVNIPADAPYSCTFRLGDCDYSGPLVGIECSRRRLPPAPPPPPSPPSPPPAPPPVSHSIRLRGPNGGLLEPNLCGSSPGLCAYFNRIELQVAPPGGSGVGMIWAPLCSVPPALRQAVGNVACWQVYNWPRFARRPDFLVLSEPSEQGFPIPRGPLATADVHSAFAFDPSKVAGWVTVASNRSYDTALRIQDLDLKVSNKSCETGQLFAVACVRRARR